MVDEQSCQIVDEKKPSLVVANMCIVNAYYDIMSTSFKPTAYKTTNRLGHVRITPIKMDRNQPENNLKEIPFIDEFSKEPLCFFRVKFWQNTNQSGSNTLTKDVMGKNSASSTDSKTSIQSVPILSPIYFSISNDCQNFIHQFRDFFIKT